MTNPETIPDHLIALPCWQGPITTAEPMSGGMSNESWKVTDGAGTHVVRFGRDYPFHHVDRAREAMVARAAAEAGLAPAVHHVAPGVMVTAYLGARTYAAPDVRAAPDRLAALLHRFHAELPARISGAAFLFCPFHVVRDYIRTLSGSQHGGIDLGRLSAINAALEAAQPPERLVFGHNDLLPANILEEPDGRLWLIDFEYAGFASALFDLAGLAANADMERDEGLALLAAYDGNPPDAARARAFDAMVVAAALREALWALVSDLHLSAPGADYQDYYADNRARFDRVLDAYQTRHGKIAP